MALDATVLLIGRRSGVGKTTVAFEASELLQSAGVPHCLVDGRQPRRRLPEAAR